MKKTLWLATAVALFLMLSVSGGYAQPMGPGMMGPGYGYGPSPDENWNYCPYCGGYLGPGSRYGMGYGYGMGPGMMGRSYGGYGMGPGMMGPGYGYGMGPGMMGRGYGMMGPGSGYGYGPQSPQLPKPLDQDQAKQAVENYLKSTRNPNLKVGKVEEKGDDFEVDIDTKDGSLVNKVLVDKDTGWMRSAY
jgi:hypothetical protein